MEVRSRATASTAAQFLATLKSRLPFPLRAIQVDGGSEFMAQFEEACQQAGLRLFVLPPRSPKLNGQVERAHRTHIEEFWECYDGDLELASVGPALLAWEKLYNTVRPHQALGWRTPAEYISTAIRRWPPLPACLICSGRAQRAAARGRCCYNVPRRSA